MRKSGVKFGLIGTASSLKKGEANRGRPIGSKPPPRRKPAGGTAVFDADSDDEQGSHDEPSGVAAVNKRLAAISTKQEKQAKKDYEDALKADPSVFDYDRVYDGMQESRESKVAAASMEREKEKRQPKYIGNLLKQAKLRAVESDRVFDRKLQKEREEQDKVEGEATMKFVTSAYKKKLMEQKKWELQQKLEDEREQREDVTKTGMSGFYSNLITKNIAMGGDVEKSATSAFTAGSKRHTATDSYELGEDGKDRAAAKPPNEGGPDGDDAGSEYTNSPSDAVGDSRDADDDGASESTARMVDPRASGAAGASGSKNIQDVSGGGGDNDTAGSNASPDATRSPGARRVRRREERSQHEDHRGDDQNGGKRARHDGADSRRAGDAGEQGGGEGAGTAASAAEAAAKAAAAKAKRDAAVKAARERFLARKKAS